jgi:hypothetical protein
MQLHVVRLQRLQELVQEVPAEPDQLSPEPEQVQQEPAQDPQVLHHLFSVLLAEPGHFALIDHLLQVVLRLENPTSKSVNL